MDTLKARLVRTLELTNGLADRMSADDLASTEAFGKRYAL